MKYLNVIFALIFLLSACSGDKQPKSYNEGINIVPLPNSVLEHDGEFKLNDKTVFSVNDEENLKVAEFFAAKMRLSTGYSLKVSSDVPSNNFIQLKGDLSLKEEEYNLVVSPQSVFISASSAKGIFYGLQTMMQLLPAEIESKQVIKTVKWNMPAVSIKDQPRFKWRGMHLDVCRHFVPVENIKKHLDMMSMFKLNTFHWHLTEDQGWRIEIKKYPLLTEIGSKRIEGEGYEYGGYYTQEQVKEIVAYAAERMIDVVPEIELPGHALAALTAYPEYSCTGGPFKVRNIWGVEPDVYCAGKEETFEFLKEIILEVIGLFPSPYFHIGGDECPKERWKSCPLCQKRIKQERLKDEHELQSYFIKRIEKVLLAQGKKMIGWDEILEGGLAETAVVMSWRGEKGGIEAATHGHDVIMTPNGWCYLDHYQGSPKLEPVAIGGYTTLEECYGYEPVPAKLSPEMSKHILGTQGNVWTEYMYTPDLVEYRVYPRIIALAEVNWTNKDLKDFSSFKERINNQFVRMDLHDINYHIPMPEGPCNKMTFVDSIALNFTTTRPIEMFYTVNGSEPNLKSTPYSGAVKFNETAVLKIRTALPTGKLGKVRTVIVEKSEYIQPVEVDATNIGLTVKLAEGQFHEIKDVNVVKEWTKKTVSTYKEANALLDSKKNDNAAIFEAYLNIPEKGIYRFSSNMDELWIANRLLISNDGEVKKHSRNDATIALQKGLHPVKMICINSIKGGWPQAWNGVRIFYRKESDKKFKALKPEDFTY